MVTINSHGSRGLSVEGQGTAIVVGEGSLGTTTKYYLIMDPVSHSTELYQQNVANSKIGLMQLTQSQTQKAALSVDMLSGEAAYLSDSISANTLSPVLPATTASTTAAANDAHVIVWNPSTKKENRFRYRVEPRFASRRIFRRFRACRYARVGTNSDHERVSTSYDSIERFVRDRSKTYEGSHI